MNKTELKAILAEHTTWLDSNEQSGKRADLQGANLKGANLLDADLLDADLQGANLKGANLQGANLRCADLLGADLLDADLPYADLRYADLRGADLRGADLRGADLRYADLRGADLRGADLQDINLSESKGLKFSYCSFSKHGERGRQLLLVEIENEKIFFCGCFKGSTHELKEFIDNDEAELKQTREIAMNFCLSTIDL